MFLEFLPFDYFNLFATYIFGIRFLYEPVRPDDIDAAELLIKEYVESLKDYFGLYAYDFTIHAHLHLAQQVREHGPLYETSQFVFEVS